MKSPFVVFTNTGHVEVQYDEIPDLSPGELQVEAACTLISTGTELKYLLHDYGGFPVCSGYSFAGRVRDVGKGVEGFHVGDRVTAQINHRLLANVTPEILRRIPDGVSDEEATWSTLSCVVQQGVRKAQLRLGDVVVVVGLGLLGQLAVQYARLSGADKIIALDTAHKRLELAASHGATHTLQCAAEEASNAVAEMTNGEMADVVFDITGHSQAFASALKLLRRFGKLVLIGDAIAPSEQCLVSEVIKRDLQIIGSHGPNAPTQASDFAPWTHSKMTRLFHDYLQRGQMQVGDLVTHRFPIAQAPQAYELLMKERDGAVGVLLDFRAPLAPG